MTVKFTIGCIFMAIAMALSLFHVVEMLEQRRKILLLPILVLVGGMLILSSTSQPRLDKYYRVENPTSYQDLFPNAYEEGFYAGVKYDGNITIDVNNNN